MCSQAVSALPEYAAGFTRLDAYYVHLTKWQHWGMFILWKRNCTFLQMLLSQKATGADFLDVQKPLYSLVYDWDPSVSSVKR